VEINLRLIYTPNTLYIHPLHTFFTYILYIHPLHTSFTYILYIHPLHTSFTYILYKNPSYLRSKVILRGKSKTQLLYTEIGNQMLDSSYGCFLENWFFFILKITLFLRRYSRCFLGFLSAELEKQNIF